MSPYLGLAVDALLLANKLQCPVRPLNLEMNQSQQHGRQVCPKMLIVNVGRLKELDLLSQVVLRSNPVFASHCLSHHGKVT